MSKSSLSISGIYKITFSGSDRLYYGSSKSLRCRKSQHLSKLRAGKHQNIIMQRLYNKLGEDSFQFDKVCCVESTDLIMVEQFFLDSMDRATAINLSFKAGSNSNRVKHPKDVIRKVFELRSENKTLQDISTETGIDRGNVSRILTRDLHSDVSINKDILTKVQANDGLNFTSADKHELVLDIFKLRASGLSQKAIGKLKNLNQSFISRVLNRKRYGSVPVPSHFLESA